MNRAGFFAALLATLALAPLAGCVTTSASGDPVIIGTADGTTSAPETVATAQGSYLPRTGAAPVAGTLREAVKVAILIPQSGPNAAMGEALMQAAQLAVFDVNEPQFQLVPKDTKGTAEGARAAVDEAAREGVKLILGPLFAQEVSAAKTAAQAYGLTVIGFSTDWRVAGGNAFTMGVLPFGQPERMAGYAARQNLRRVAVVTSSDMYGDAVLQLFEASAKRYGISVTKVVRVAPDGSNAAVVAQQLQGGQVQPAFDAIFMPLGAKATHLVAAALQPYGLTSTRVRYMGTGLWDDGALTADPLMAGAVYAAPAPAVRAAFERNYMRIYGATPPRLASIGYDSAALAIVLARNATAAGQKVSYDRSSLLNPNGFSGVDGIFRFRADGLVERGMAVLQIAGGSVHMAEGAPASFAETASVR